MATVDLHRLSALLALGLAGCASLGPYEGPQANADEHTLCYTRAAATPEQLRTLAKEACNGAEPRLHDQEMDWAACPLLVPERLYFSCGTS